MLRTRVIPILLLKNNGLVKTIKFKNPVYVGDPINAVKIFNEKEVDELVLLDITATNDKKEINYNKIEEIVSEAFMPIGYGGGIKSLDQIEKLFKLGVEKVIINSEIFKNLDLITDAAKVFGNQSIVASLDVKKDFFGNKKIYSHSGTEKIKEDLVSVCKNLVNAGVGEILINSIDKDGTMSGYDTDLISEVSKSVEVPVVSCGGAGSIEDFAKAVNAGASAVAAGAMFVFQGIHRAVLISYPNYDELENILRGNK
jgi:cyclase